MDEALRMKHRFTIFGGHAILNCINIKSEGDGKIKKLILRAALSLLPALLLVCAAAGAALAASYPAGQYYEHDTSLTKVTTVQIRATNTRESAEKSRDQMIAAGFDAFVYHRGDKYRIMCGKFRDIEEASDYQNRIINETDFDKAYATNAYLPESAIKAFEDIYFNGDVTSENAPRSEKPAGPYYDGEALPNDTVTVYTVQVTAGTAFAACEERRDNLIARGYSDSFVYRTETRYKVMTGMFRDINEANARCSEVQSFENKAYVTTVTLPAYAVSGAPAPAPSTQSQPTPVPSTQSQPTPAPSTQSQSTPAPSTQSQPTPAPSIQSQPTAAPATPSQPSATPSQPTAAPATPNQSAAAPATPSQSAAAPATPSQSAAPNQGTQSGTTSGTGKRSAIFNPALAIGSVLVLSGILILILVLEEGRRRRSD